MQKDWGLEGDGNLKHKVNGATCGGLDCNVVTCKRGSRRTFRLSGHKGSECGVLRRRRKYQTGDARKNGGCDNLKVLYFFHMQVNQATPASNAVQGQIASEARIAKFTPRKRYQGTTSGTLFTIIILFAG